MPGRTLPVGRAVRRIPSPSRPACENDIGVVVADDSADIRLLLRLRLEQEGYRVLGEATDGVELLALVDRVRPEVILLDVAMPGMDGLEAAALVRQRLPEVKIVILSGYGRDRMAADAARAGADAYVEKGASGSELFGVLDTLLAGRAGSRPGDAHPVGDVDVLYRMLLDTLAEGVVLLTADGIVQAANPAAGELFARPVDRLVGAPWEQLGELAADGRPANTRTSAVLRALRSGDGEARELAIRRADGDIRWVVVSVRPIRRDGLARSYAVMSLLDVTDRRALAREREVSQALQRAVLPARLPEVRGVTLAADYMPAAEGAKVGGDWYDAVSLPDGCVTLVIGDVEGHDVAAAGLMGQIRSVIRGYALEGHPPAQALELANRYLLDLGVDRIVTVALVQLHPAEQVAIVASAGHLPPLLARPDEAPVYLDRGLGPPLGIDASIRWRENTVIVPPASTLIMFTDGLVEHVRSGSITAGLEALRTRVDRGRADVSALVDGLMATPGTGRLTDDVAVLATRLAPAQLPANLVRRRLPARPVSVPIARWFVADLLAGWDVSAAVWDTAELLLSEVVTNACRHSEDDIELRIERHDEHVRFSVADTSHRRPTVHESGPDETSGRGLQLVDMLASTWGIESGGLGNVVWFEVRSSPAEMDLAGAWLALDL